MDADQGSRLDAALQLTDVVLSVERLASIRTRAEDGERSALFGGARSFLSRPLLTDDRDLEKLGTLPSYRSRFAKLLLQVFQTVCESDKPAIIGSKLPIGVSWEDVNFLRSRFADLRIILVVRNPVDVVNSSLTRGQNAALGMDEWPVREAAAALNHWRQAMRTMFDVVEENLRAVLVIKFEDLCRDPAQQELMVRRFASLDTGGSEHLAIAEPRKSTRSALSPADMEFLSSELGDIDEYWSGLSALETIRAFGDQAPLIEPGELLSWANGGCSAMARAGFSYPENWGRWTDGRSARIRFRPGLTETDGRLRLHILYARVPEGCEGAPVRIRVNDGLWVDHLVRKSAAVEIVIPKVRSIYEVATVSLDIQEPKPLEEEPITDARRLGIGVVGVELLP